MSIRRRLFRSVRHQFTFDRAELLLLLITRIWPWRCHLLLLCCGSTLGFRSDQLSLRSGLVVTVTWWCKRTWRQGNPRSISVAFRSDPRIFMIYIISTNNGQLKFFLRRRDHHPRYAGWELCDIWYGSFGIRLPYEILSGVHQTWRSEAQAIKTQTRQTVAPTSAVRCVGWDEG